MKQEFLQIRIGADLLSNLRTAAAASDKSASLFVREAIREKLARETANSTIVPFPKAVAAEKDEVLPTPSVVRTEKDSNLLANLKANMEARKKTAG